MMVDAVCWNPSHLTIDMEAPCKYQSVASVILCWIMDTPDTVGCVSGNDCISRAVCTTHS